MCKKSEPTPGSCKDYGLTPCLPAELSASSPAMPTPIGKHHFRTAGGTTLLLLCVLGGAGLAASATAPDKEPPATSASTKTAAAAAAPDSPAAWTNLFDGRSLAGWQVTGFAGHGDVLVKDGRIILESGVMTGVTWTNDLPRTNYEISLDAMRVDGNDFFCGLTFPVGKDPCSFIVGGWGGGVVGLSSLDGEDAAHNETTQYMNFQNGRWFQIRVRVTATNIQAWIDSDKMVDVTTTGKAISIRPEVEESKPLGIASWSTTAALRNIKMRRL